MTTGISETGDRLGIVINCHPHLSDNWASFAAWYSFHKNLPDAKVAVAYNRLNATYDVFKWAYACKVTILTYSHKDPNDVLPAMQVFNGMDLVKIISSHTMAVRTYNSDNLGPVDVRSENAATLVSYEDGCGRFITSEWINSVGHPFHNARRRFGNVDPTVNELKVLELWEKAGSLFTF